QEEVGIGIDWGCKNQVGGPLILKQRFSVRWQQVKDRVEGDCDHAISYLTDQEDVVHIHNGILLSH
ncbi:hypothetical protein PSZ74_24275, partial [Shigella sonnei]|nr:hypothetical protein [Shigella sonnei]